MSSRLPVSYEAYLASAEWRQRRKEALWRAQNRCQSPSCRYGYLRAMTDEEIAETLPRRIYRLEVHHLTYDRLGHEHPDDLIVLCRACHAGVHGLPYEPPTERLSITLQDALISVIERMIEGMAAS